MTRLGYALLASCAVPIATLATPTPALAQEATYNFDIPAQPLPAAIIQFSRQTGIAITAPRDLVSGKRSSVVRGQMTSSAALTTLLRGTGLRFDIGQGGSVTVLPQAVEPFVSGEAEAGGAAADSGSATETGLPILVTGTRIRGVRDLAVPADVYERNEILNGGYLSPQDLLDDIPQNFSEISTDGTLGRGLTRLGFDNKERATGANLRGLGSESTLTLVNGTRRAGSVNGRVVDISSIPTVAIDRIEIVTGGQSSVYGADAVAGVVNVITRSEYSGLEVQAAGGLAGEGGERLQASSIAGTEFNGGGFAVAYEFNQEWPFNLVDAGLVGTPSGITRIDRIEIQPKRDRNLFYGSARWSPTDWLELNADAQYALTSLNTLRTLELRTGATQLTFQEISSDAEQLHINLSATARLSNDIRFISRFTASDADIDIEDHVFFDLGPTRPIIDEIETTDSRSSIDTVSGVLDGSIPLGITPRFSLGYEHRRESLLDVQSTDGVQDSLDDRQRNVNSLFAELRLPLVEPESRSFLSRLELTGGIRWDRYSDFGDTTNYQGGLIIEPVDGIVLKGAYATAFRAPALYELGESVFAAIELIPNPAGGTRPLLFLTGDRLTLQPERAKTWSATLEWAPRWLRWLRGSVSYFDIDYRDRLSQPTIASAERRAVLSNVAQYGDLLDTSPSESSAQAVLALVGPSNFRNITTRPYVFGSPLLNVFPDLVVFDNRINNISVENARGIDATVNMTFPAMSGELGLSSRLSYTIEHVRRILPSSAPQPLLNQTGKPADFRVRSTLSWTGRSLGAYISVNHVGGYENTLVTPSAPVSSWTTFDVTLRAELPNGFTARLSVDNILDEDPPFIAGHPSGLLYDPTNASGIGRFVSFRVTKRF